MRKIVDIELDADEAVDELGEEALLKEMDLDEVLRYLKKECGVDDILDVIDFDDVVDYLGVKDLIIAACSTKCNEALLDRATAKKVMSELIDDYFLF